MDRSATTSALLPGEIRLAQSTLVGLNYGQAFPGMPGGVGGKESDRCRRATVTADLHVVGQPGVLAEQRARQRADQVDAVRDLHFTSNHRSAETRR